MVLLCDVSAIVAQHRYVKGQNAARNVVQRKAYTLKFLIV